MIWIGIDPGKGGAIAALGGDEDKVCDMPESPAGVAKMLVNFVGGNDCLAALEKVSAMPGQGVSSMFNFGTGYGVLQGVMSTLGIRYLFVTPQKWQTVFDSMKRGDRKQMSLDFARRMFPEVDLSKKKHHGRADALLIALWLKRQNVAPS